MRSAVVACALLAGIAVGALATRSWLPIETASGPGSGVERPAGEPAGPATASATGGSQAVVGADAASPAPPPVDPDRRRLAQPDGPGAPGSMKDVIDYPVAAKYERESLSRVPHRLIGAWDAEPQAEQPADKRVFIAVVEPSTSDRDLEDLLRDADAAHADAAFLRVRVFDSESAARRPSWTDDGAASRQHLVAELVRTPTRPAPLLRVR